MPTTVLLTKDGREHKFVANRLAENGLIDAVIVEQAVRQGRSQRFRKLVKRHGYTGLVGRGLLRCWDYWGGPRAARAAALRKLLGESSDDFAVPELVRRVEGINSVESIQHLMDLRPDIILVYGTSIIAPRVLELARDRALNMHTGISPNYRGADCAFWPLYNKEFDMLGATVHECTEALDGGRVFGRTFIELKEDDDIEAVFARCVIAGAGLYSSVVKERPWSQPGSGEIQDLSVGRVYQSTMRNLRAELLLRRKVRGGLIREHVRQVSSSREEAGK